MNEMPHARNAEGPGDIDWDDFRVFLEVVRTGSFNRAAVRLKMTQPTVSRRLGRLERCMGVRLFDRDRRGPRLTSDGQRIYADTCTAQAALSRAASQVPGAGRRVEGDCKILMGEGIAAYWMSRFVAPFFSRHPNVELKIFGSHDPAIEKRELFDLNIHYYEPFDGHSITLRLGTMHLVPFASREYLRIHGVPKTVEALARHRLLDLAIYLSDIGSWRKQGHEDVDFQALLFTNITGCLAESVRHGAGIGLLPTYSSIVDDDLVPLEIGVHFAFPMYLSYPRDAVKKWAVRAALEFVRTRVFDKKSMPWFRDSFIAPQMDWRKRLSRLIDRATMPPAGEKISKDAAAWCASASGETPEGCEAEDKKHQKNCDEQEEEELRNGDGGAGNCRKSKDARHQSQNQKNNCPPEHSGLIENSQKTTWPA